LVMVGLVLKGLFNLIGHGFILMPRASG